MHDTRLNQTVRAGRVNTDELRRGPDAQERALRRDLRTGVQAHLALLHFALLRFTDAAFFNKSKADPPAAQRSLVALLRYSLYHGALGPNPQ